MLHSYSAEGDIKQFYPPTAEAAALGLTNWGALEWAEKDPEIEAAFAPYDTEGNPRTVTAFVVDGVLTFEYEAIPEPTEFDDPYKIIDTLTGEAG